MSIKAYSFPAPKPELSDFGFPRTTFESTALDGLDWWHETYARERSRQAKYPGAVLAELYDAGEITKEQYERLRRESR